MGKIKFHFTYREFAVDFFKMLLDFLTKNRSFLRFRKFDVHVLSLCLMLRVTLSLSLRKIKNLYNISVSRQQIANCCKTAEMCVKPFVDNYGYNSEKVFIADETDIKVRDVKACLWFVMDTAKRSILSYCQLPRFRQPRCRPMHLCHAHDFPASEKAADFRFLTDGSSACSFAAWQFFYEFGEVFKFCVT